MSLCNTNGQFDAVEKLWIKNNVIPVLNCQAPPNVTNPPPAGVPSGTGGGGGGGTNPPTLPSSGPTPAGDTVPPWQLGTGMADNLNYPGGDLPGAGYNSDDPRHCQADCQGDSLGTFCYAWTWVKPGVQGTRGKCWQKDKSHALCNYDTNTVSGAKPADDTNTCPIGPHGNGGPVPGAP